MAPIDKELINKNLLNKNERKWINQYHKKVYNSIRGFLIKSELQELREACSTI